MNNILKYILDFGLVAPIAVITMTLVYYFDLDNFITAYSINWCVQNVNQPLLTWEKY